MSSTERTDIWDFRPQLGGFDDEEICCLTQFRQRCDS